MAAMTLSLEGAGGTAEVTVEVRSGDLAKVGVLDCDVSAGVDVETAVFPG